MTRISAAQFLLLLIQPVGTVDHFYPSTPEKPAYEWRNFRFAAGWINSSKSKAADILDPLAVQAGWFEVLLPSLQLVVTEHVPDEFRAQAQHTLIRMHLRDDERVIRQRRRWYHMYQEGKLSLEGLRQTRHLLLLPLRNKWRLLRTKNRLTTKEPACCYFTALKRQ